MENKKILILKNDRAGDFISSVKLISELKSNNNKIDIYLSKYNYNFRFLTPDCNFKKINYRLNIIDKIKIFLDIFKNKYDEVFILSPKNFYFFLPIFFKKIKFYALVINGKKRNRPALFLRKFLHKISVRYRNKLNKYNIIEHNLNLIDKKNKFDIKKLNLSNENPFFFKYLSDNYIYFQFRKIFFEKLNWNVNEFEKLINFLNTKYKTVVFSADIEKNNYDEYFYRNFTSIDFQNNFSYTKKENKNIIYLKKIDPPNLFYIVRKADKILNPHGVITQISHLLNKDSINLFNFKINNIKEYHHEKISFSEWYSNMGIKFIFLNNDFNKALRKISKFI